MCALKGAKRNGDLDAWRQRTWCLASSAAPRIQLAEVEIKTHIYVDQSHRTLVLGPQSRGRGDK